MKRVRSRYMRLCGRWLVAIAAAMAAPVAAGEHLVEVAWSPRGDYKAELRIAPKGFKELCVALVKGDRVEWSFYSPEDMSFNIHYHVGSDVSYPAKVEGIRAGQGTLDVTVDQHYCWLWKAGANPVDIVATLRRRPVREQ